MRELAERWGGRQLLGVCRSAYGRVLATGGDWPAAEAELTGAVGDLEARGPGWPAAGFVRLGELRARQGRHEEARALFERAGAHPRALVGLGELALARRRRGVPRPTPPSASLRRLAATSVLDRLPAARAAGRAPGRARRPRGRRGRARGASRPRRRGSATPYLRGRARLCAAELAAARGDHDTARRACEDAHRPLHASAPRRTTRARARSPSPARWPPSAAREPRPPRRRGARDVRGARRRRRRRARRRAARAPRRRAAPRRSGELTAPRARGPAARRAGPRATPRSPSGSCSARTPCTATSPTSARSCGSRRAPPPSPTRRAPACSSDAARWPVPAIRARWPGTAKTRARRRERTVADRCPTTAIARHPPSTSCASACAAGSHEPGDRGLRGRLHALQRDGRAPPAPGRALRGARRRRRGARASPARRASRSPSAAGGHSVAGMSLVDDGLVIDVRAHERRSTSTRSAASRASAAAPRGRRSTAPRRRTGSPRPAAASPPPGVAGLTLGGGSGWLERKHGLACDNLLARRARHRRRRARPRVAPTSTPSCSGRCAAAAATSASSRALEFRLHPVGPEVFAGLAAATPPSAAGELLRAVPRRDARRARGARPRLRLHHRARPRTDIPAELHGQPRSWSPGMYAGPVEEGEAPLARAARVRPAGRGLLRADRPTPTSSARSTTRPATATTGPPSTSPTSRTPRSTRSSQRCERASRAARRSCSSSPWGGAVARVADELAARGPRHRASSCTRCCSGRTRPTTSANIALRPRATATTCARTRPAPRTSTSSATRAAARLRAGFRPGDYERLQQIKAEWDPENVFHGNQNIRPAGT